MLDLAVPCRANFDSSLLLCKIADETGAAPM
jgi:hypothetical protein